MSLRDAQDLPAPSSSPTIEDLKAALTVYSSDLFQYHFKYALDGPKSAPPDSFNDNIYRMGGLLSYVDDDTSSFEKDVETHVTR